MSLARQHGFFTGNHHHHVGFACGSHGIGDAAFIGVAAILQSRGIYHGILAVFFGQSLKRGHAAVLFKVEAPCSGLIVLVVGHRPHEGYLFNTFQRQNVVVLE